MGHGVACIECQRLSQDQFRFLIAILGQQGPCFAKPAEAALTSGRRRPAETIDRLIAAAQRVDQGPGEEPRLGQGPVQLRGAVVRSDRTAGVALLLQGDSQRRYASASFGLLATARSNAAMASGTRPASRHARPRSCWMRGLDGSSSAASRKGAIAAAARPALSNSVAHASRDSSSCCRGWA